MKNVAMPGGPRGLDAVAAAAATSQNTPETLQLSMDPNRLRPAHRESGPSGRANIEEGAVLEGMPIATAGTKATQAARRRYLTS